MHRQTLSRSAARLLLPWLLLGFALPLMAQQAPIEKRMTPTEFKAAGLGKLSAAELERLNAWLAGSAWPVARAGVAPRPAVAAPAGKRSRLPFIAQGEGAVRSRAKGTIQSWTIGSVFELENGQKWQVVAGETKMYRAISNPEVTVVPGLGGRWFMQMDADPDVAKPKVERIE